MGERPVGAAPERLDRARSRPPRSSSLGRAKRRPPFGVGAGAPPLEARKSRGGLCDPHRPRMIAAGGARSCRTAWHDPRTEEQQLLAVARGGGRAGCAELQSRFGRRQSGVRTKSRPTDLVSDADIAAEAAIRAVLADAPARRRDPRRGGRSDRRRRACAGSSIPSTARSTTCTRSRRSRSAWPCEDVAGTIAGRGPRSGARGGVRRRRGRARRRSTASRCGRDRTAPDSLGVTMVATGFGYDQRYARRAGRGGGARAAARARHPPRRGRGAGSRLERAAGASTPSTSAGCNAWDLAAGALVAERSGLAVRELPESDGSAVGRDDRAGEHRRRAVRADRRAEGRRSTGRSRPQTRARAHRDGGGTVDTRSPSTDRCHRPREGPECGGWDSNPHVRSDNAF